MDPAPNPIAANQALWNALTEVHFRSKMYDVEAFVEGRNSLTRSELELIGTVR